MSFSNTASRYGAMVKIWAESDHKYGSYDVKLIFKMAAAAIL
jgi:hypothetical protein